MMNGKAVKESVDTAIDFIVKSILDTPTELDYEPNGVNFQKHLEMLIDDEVWPLPKYRELLFF